jgi:hypothetical protein
MKSFAILPLAIVFATTGAIGQNVVKAGPATLPLRPFSLNSVACPIDLRATHGTLFMPKKTDFGPSPAPSPAPQEQTLHLTVTNHSPQKIVTAQLTIHGFSNKWRDVPLLNATAAPDLVKKVEVVLNVKANAQSSSDLSLSRFTSIAAIDLDSVTYADGSSWQSSSPAACSVAPDPMMLISDAR